MAKFNVGDRVSIARIDSADEGLGLRLGQIGKVVSLCDEASRNFGTVYVDLDEELPEVHQVVSDGRWRAYENQLQIAALIGPVNVGEAIAAYTSACEQFEAAELALEKAKASVQDARLNLRDALDGET